MKKTRFSTAYLCVSVLLLLFLFFVPLGNMVCTSADSNA